MKGLIASILISVLSVTGLYAAADTFRVISGSTGRLVKTESPIATNLTVEGTLAITGATTQTAAMTINTSIATD